MRLRLLLPYLPTVDCITWNCQPQQTLPLITCFCHFVPAMKTGNQHAQYRVFRCIKAETTPQTESCVLLENNLRDNFPNCQMGSINLWTFLPDKDTISRHLLCCSGLSDSGPLCHGTVSSELWALGLCVMGSRPPPRRGVQ